MVFASNVAAVPYGGDWKYSDGNIFSKGGGRNLAEAWYERVTGDVVNIRPDIDEATPTNYPVRMLVISPHPLKDIVFGCPAAAAGYWKMVRIVPVDACL